MSDLSSVSTFALGQSTAVREAMDCSPVKSQYDKAKESICIDLQEARSEMNISLLFLIGLLFLNFTASLFFVTWNRMSDEEKTNPDPLNDPVEDYDLINKSLLHSSVSNSKVEVL